MNKINIVIPMAGIGKRFSDCGYTLPKPLLSLGKYSMIECVIKNLFDKQMGFNKSFYFTFIVNIKQLNENDIFKVINKQLPRDFFQIIPIDYLPQGPADSALIGAIKTDIESPLIITNCDQIIEDWNYDIFEHFCETNNADGVLGTFHSCSPKNSYIKLSDNNEIIDIKEKRVISNIATNGFHWWKKGLYFIESFNQMKRNEDTVNGEYYVAPSYNYMIQRGMKVLPFSFNMHYPIGTPIDYEYYKKLRNL
jgi:NDP-sugar pyrophosphorylase family protein